jgi:coiled-coil domain-containing protein 6
MSDIFDSASDAGETSDASTCDDVSGPSASKLSLLARLRSLQQENTVLKIDRDLLHLKIKNLGEENFDLKRARVNLQARAEQEEEFISNTLLRKIDKLKKEKEKLATAYEQEEEYLTNDLSRKLAQLRTEKMELEQTLEQEQQNQISKLMKKIEKLESETTAKQASLEQLRKDKVDLENVLEQEQEQLVNRLWKQMDDLEVEKKKLLNKLQHPASEPPSPRSSSVIGNNPNVSNENIPRSSDQSPLQPPAISLGRATACRADSTTIMSLTSKIKELKSEVTRLKALLTQCKAEHARMMEEVGSEEKNALRQEKLLLERKLARERERCEMLNRQLSESESSLEVDDERHFNDFRKSSSSPIPVASSPIHHRSISSGLNVQVGSPLNKCVMCGNVVPLGGPNCANSQPNTAPPAFFPGPAHASPPILATPQRQRLVSGSSQKSPGQGSACNDGGR